MRQVDVAPEVRNCVPARELDEFCAALAETEVTCVICGDDLPAGSLTRVAVQVFVDPADATVFSVVASHARCAPSGVHQRPGLAEQLSVRSGIATTELDVRVVPAYPAVGSRGRGVGGVGAGGDVAGRSGRRGDGRGRRLPEARV